MPIIHIRSLPFKPELNTAGILEAVSMEFSRESGIKLKYVSAMWSYFEPGHYVESGQAALKQPWGDHPLQVELVTPDIHQALAIEKQLQILAHAISRHSGMPLHNIFIEHREVHSGHVFDNGSIIHW